MRRAAYVALIVLGIIAWQVAGNVFEFTVYNWQLLLTVILAAAATIALRRTPKHR